MNSLFETNKEYTLNEVVSILKENNQFSKVFFYNIRGWDSTFSLNPTSATPTGRLYKEGFPAKVRIESHNKGNKIEVKPVKFIYE